MGSRAAPNFMPFFVTYRFNACIMQEDEKEYAAETDAEAEHNMGSSVSLWDSSCIRACAYVCVCACACVHMHAYVLACVSVCA